MKLGLLADASSYHTDRWRHYFADRGWEVHLISLQNPIFKSTAVEHILSPPTGIAGIDYLLRARNIKNILEKIRPDIVNAHFVPNYGFAGALAGVRPLVISAWGSDVLLSAEKSFFHRQRARFALGHADLVTTDAVNLARAVERLGVPASKIITVPMGVDLALWPQHKISTTRGIQVLSYRRLEPVSDLELLVRAIPAVISKIKLPIRFVIAGTGSQKKYLVDLATRLSILDRARFPGELSPTDLHALVSESDIYVSTSLSDSTSVSLLESMASGLFPIVSDIPGNREWIDHGKNGLLFSPGRSDELTRQIVRAAENRHRWHTAAALNRSIIVERALWQKNMGTVESAFRKLSR